MRDIIYCWLVGRRQHPPSSLPIRFKSSSALKESINAKFSSTTTKLQMLQNSIAKVTQAFGTTQSPEAFSCGD